MNVALRMLDMFLYQDSILHKNFPGGSTDSCTVIASIFFENGISKNVKEIENNHMDSEKSIDLF